MKAFANDYEDWPGYCEWLLTREEMLAALAECEEKWPDYAFRGHHVPNQQPGSDRLRSVRRGVALDTSEEALGRHRV